MTPGRSATYWIDKLGLVRHPEGGWFRESYRSAESIAASALPPRFSGPRSFATSIYFLLEGSDFSALHRLKSDELWHFHCGSALTVHVLTPQGEYRQIRLGGNPEAGEELQGVVEAGCWFGATVEDVAGYALVGCTVAPGFNFSDFEMARGEDLQKEYPEHADVVEQLTRQGVERY